MTNDINNIPKPTMSSLESTFAAMKKLQEDIYINQREFMNAINANDVEKAKLHFNWGLNWEDERFYKDFLTKFSSLNQSFEMLDFLTNININEKNIPSKELISLKLKNDLKDRLFKKISFSLSGPLFELSLKNNPELHNNLRFQSGLKNTQWHLKDLSLPEYKSFHDYLLKHDHLVKIFFANVNDQKNLDWLMNHQDYNNKISHLINEPNYSKDLLNNAIGDGKIDKLKLLKTLGFTPSLRSDNKKSFSDLFASKSKTECALYVLDFVEDIYAYNNIILRTALHYDCTKLIMGILYRYKAEDADMIEAELKDRVNNDAYKIVEKVLVSMKLSNNLNQNIPQKNDMTKRNKI